MLLSNEFMLQCSSPKKLGTTTKTNVGSQALTSSPKVNSHCVCNSIFTLLRVSVHSRKGKTLSNDSRTVKFLFSAQKYLGWGGAGKV